MNNVVKIILALLLLIVLFMVGCQSYDEPSNGMDQEGNQVGDLAHDFKLLNLEGQSVSLSDFRGSPVLINFWATWCGPCRYEMPYLQQIYQEWSDKGLVMLAIDKRESKAKVEDYLETMDFSIPVLLDIDNSVSSAYGIIGIPTTFFVDKDGIIQQKVIGAFPSKMAIERELRKIIP